MRLIPVKKKKGGRLKSWLQAALTVAADNEGRNIDYIHPLRTAQITTIKRGLNVTAHE